MKKVIGWAITAMLVSTGCGQQGPQSGLVLENFDATVRPQDDLYRHVNGKWLDTFEIPADKSNYGSFTKLAEEAKTNLRTIIEDAAKGEATPGSEKQKIGDLYASYMDSAGTEQIGLTPLADDLKRIDAMKSTADVQAVIA